MFNFRDTEKFEDTKGAVRNLKSPYNDVQNILHRTLKSEHHEPHYNRGWTRVW